LYLKGKRWMNREEAYRHSRLGEHCGNVPAWSEDKEETQVCGTEDWLGYRKR
jgi:hypothetical protein